MRTHRTFSRTGLALVVCTAALAAPVAAQATTVSSDGTTITVIGTEGNDYLSVSVDFDGILKVTEATAGPGCTANEWDTTRVECTIGAGGIQIYGLGGNDDVVAYQGKVLAPGMYRADLGAGNDTFHASELPGPVTVNGGEGNDAIEGSTDGDVLDGGAGDDKVEGINGADVVRGGEGDDIVIGDASGRESADVIDGGPGIDTTDDWRHYEREASEITASVTLDGVANDGFPGEGDNVTSVERLKAGAGLVYVGDDSPNYVIASELGQRGDITGLGGDDELAGTDRADVIDGGAGADLIRGGYGNDTIVGGPGKDTLIGDRDGRCNEMHCDLSPGSAADTIDSVDGEVDTVSCGPGSDAVRADAIDTVDADCEAITRVGGTTPPPGAAQNGSAGPGAPPAAPAVRVALAGKAPKLAAALRHGLRITVSGQAAGRAVTVKALKGAKVLAKATATANAAGKVTTTLKFTAAVRRSLATAKRVTVTLVAGTAKVKVTLVR